MVHTIIDALITCGVDNINNVNGGQNNSQRLAEDMFGGTFTTCLDKTFTEMDTELKGYSDLTQAQGQIRLMPGTKRKIKAFCPVGEGLLPFG